LLDDQRRHFTVEAANAFVPRLQEVFTAVRGDLEGLRDLARELAAAGFPLSDDGPVEVDASAPSDVQRRQIEAHGLAGRIGAALDEVAALGVEVKGVDGLVDFRSRRDGEVVYLCWRFGEERIAHWHELDGGFAGRQTIRPDDDFEGDELQ
jgi:hypothetical protein